MMNYKLSFADKEEEEEGAAKGGKKSLNSDIQRIKEIIFRGKPKRVFRSNRKADVAF